jgi:hypothetical protein
MDIASYIAILDPAKASFHIAYTDNGVLVILIAINTGGRVAHIMSHQSEQTFVEKFTFLVPQHLE